MNQTGEFKWNTNTFPPSVPTAAPAAECSSKSLDGRLISTWPHKTHPVNQGKLCIKGWSLHEYITSPMRMTSPLVKEDGRFKKVGWDRALERAAQGLKQVIDEHGPESVGVLVSAKDDQRGELPGPEVRPGGPGNQQRGSLRPSLTQLHGGRSGPQHSVPGR